MFDSLRDALENYSKDKKIAIEVYNGSICYYEELLEFCDEFKEFCLNENIKNDSRIAVISKDLLCQALFGLAVFECCTLCPVDIELSKEQIKYYYRLLKIDYIITDELSSIGFKAAEELGLGIIEFNIITGNMGLDLDYRLIRYPTKIAKKPEYNCKISIIATTSGTTSTPKIVPIKYDSNIIGNKNMNIYYELGEDSNTIIFRKPSRISFISGLVRSILSGSKVVLLDGFNHKEIGEVIKKRKITWFTAAPAVLLSFADYIEKNNISIHPNDLDFIRSSGANINREDVLFLEKVFKVPLVVTYGMTEANKITTTYKAPKGFKEGSVGVSIGPDLKVEQGEILVKGDTVFPGYENDDYNRHDYFTGDGWFKTGDEGYIDEDGYVFITGRIKEMINKGGEKVSPYEVEKLVLENCRAKRAYVFPYPNQIGSEDVGLVVVQSDDEIVTLKDIRRNLKGKISAYKMPTLLFKVKEVPVSKNGKVQRKILYDIIKNMDQKEVLKEEVNDIINKNNRNENRSIEEEFLIKLWKELLDLENISVESNFFELGGDSLSAAAALSQIENEFGIQIPVITFFELGTVKEISKYIKNKERIYKLKFLFPIKDSGNREPLFCIHTSDGEAVTYHNIGKYIDEDIPVYAFKFNLREEWNHPLTFRELGVKYADEILKKQTTGEYHLLGRCYGGVLALEVAQELIRRGKAVREVFMLDSPNLSKLGDKIEVIDDNVYVKKWKNSINQMGSKKAKEIPHYLYRKTISLFKLTRDRLRYPVYRLGVRFNRGRMIKFAGKEAALRWAIRNNEQKYYNGRVYYFKANLDKVSSIDRIEYWKSMVDNLDVIEINTYHNEMDSEESMKFIAEKTSIILDGPYE